MRGEVVLSTTRLDALTGIDSRTGETVAGAGVTLASLQRHAEGAGLHFAVDIASRDACTVGGMIATNAGGLIIVFTMQALLSLLILALLVLGDRSQTKVIPIRDAEMFIESVDRLPSCRWQT